MTAAAPAGMGGRTLDKGKCPRPTSQAAIRAAAVAILDRACVPLTARVVADVARVESRADTLEWPINAATGERIVAMLAPAHWPAARTIVGGRTQRVGHLRAVLVLAREWERGRRDEPLVAALRAYGGGLIGMGAADERLDVAAIARKARAELAAITGPERAERARACARGAQAGRTGGNEACPTGMT